MTKVVEQFTDSERMLLLRLTMATQVQAPDERLIPIISRLSGTDTILIAHRAYPSHEPPST